MITTRRQSIAPQEGLREITLEGSEQVLVDVDAAYAGVPGRVSLTSHRILFRPLERSDTAIKLYNKLRAEIVPTLHLIEHIAVTTFDAAQSVILTLSDVCHPSPCPRSCVRSTRNSLLTTFLRLLLNTPVYHGSHDVPTPCFTPPRGAKCFTRLYSLHHVVLGT